MPLVTMVLCRIGGALCSDDSVCVSESEESLQKLRDAVHAKSKGTEIVCAVKSS